eukprot:151522_1
MKSNKYFETIEEATEAFRSLDGVIQYELTRDGKTVKWALDLTNFKIIKGGVDNPTTTMTLSDENFVKLLSGQANGAELFMSGQIKMDGDMGLAMQFQSASETLRAMNPAELYGKSKL